MTGRELVALARTDDAAFTELYTRYRQTAYLSAARYVGADAAEDVTQEFFLAMRRLGWEVVGPPVALGAVISRWAARYAINYYHAHQRRQQTRDCQIPSHEDTSDVQERRILRQLTSSPDAFELVYQRELRERIVQSFLATLNPETRAWFIAYGSGRPIAAIAADAGRTYNTVVRRIYKARLRLRVALSDIYEPSGVPGRWVPAGRPGHRELQARIRARRAAGEPIDQYGRSIGDPS